MSHMSNFFIRHAAGVDKCILCACAQYRMCIVSDVFIRHAGIDKCTLCAAYTMKNVSGICIGQAGVDKCTFNNSLYLKYRCKTLLIRNNPRFVLPYLEII